MEKKSKDVEVAEAMQISFVLDNVPGALARVAQALQKANVNIEGLCHTETTDKIVRDHMVVDNINVAKDAIMPLAKSASVEKVISLRVFDDRPGFIAAVSKKLGENYINIEIIYHASAGRGSAAVIHLGVANEDYGKALRLLKEI